MTHSELIEVPGTPSAVAADDNARARAIRAAIRSRGQELRDRLPILQRRQSEIGLTLLLGSLAGVAGCAWLYGAGVISAWLCIPLVALFCSIAHEIA